MGINTLLDFLRGSTVQKIGSAMFTQSMLSIINCFIAFSIAKYASKNDYGMYVIMFSIIELAGNYQAALINTPLTVLAPQKKATENVSFLSGLGFGQFLLLSPFIILALIISSIHFFIHQEIIMLRYVFVLSLAIPTYILREFIRTINYSKMRIHLLVKMDVIFVLFVSLSLFTLIVFHKVTSGSSITILGFGYFFSAIFGILYAKDVYDIQWKSIKKSFAETWQYSRWALVGTTSDVFKNRSYIYIVTAALGLNTIAEISFARLLLRPIGFLLNSSGKITLAKGSKDLDIKGFLNFKMFILAISCFLLMVCISYFLGLLFFYDYVIRFIGDKYGNIQGYVVLWAFFFLIHSLRYSITNALLVCKEFKALAKYGIISAIITIVTCLILIETLEAYGVIISLIVGELALLLCTISKFFSICKKEKVFKLNSKTLSTAG